MSFDTKNIPTWCPGCPNFMILESVKKALEGFDNKSVAIATDIGCHAKIFDYLNVNGIYGLHGRALSTAQGIKIGNPNLKVLAFMGDGAAYSEGIAHFVSAGRYDVDVTLIVHDNQAFSLTTGQPTPTSQKCYVSKASPFGEEHCPINPIKIALASGVGFVARANARDIAHTAEVLKKAIAHKGFSYVEIIQDCLIFNKEINNKDGIMYKVEDNFDFRKAEKLADGWDYNSRKGKIALGVLFERKC